eukprot:gene29683-758_t
MGTGNIAYHLRFLQGARDVHGVTPDYVGVMNEQAWTPAYIKALRAALDDAGFAATRLVAADVAFSWSILDAMLADPDLARSVDVLGVHHMHKYPEVTTSYPTPSPAVALGKPLWASEDGLPGIDGIPGSSFPNWAGAVTWARVLSSNLWARSLTATILCPMLNAWSRNIGETNHGFLFAREPWSGSFQL